MAVIERMRGRRASQSPSGYSRLFGDCLLGNLLSRVQGAVIASGTELEKLIWERVHQVPDFDLFVTKQVKSTKSGIWVARKEQVKVSKYIRANYEPDFLAFDLRGRVCYVVEVKDGDQFDTKKSSSEYAMLHAFADSVRYAIPLEYQIRICCFNTNDKEQIYVGLKRKFSLSEILTGKELCSLFRINYDDIVAARYRDQAANLEYLVRELLRIPRVRDLVGRYR